MTETDFIHIITITKTFFQVPAMVFERLMQETGMVGIYLICALLALFSSYIIMRVIKKSR